ncbi:MAG: putative DNA binding domain-containing protein [Planctomycetes bacterium]|nr:putative DNA binding domain-containing protein [Planctomycetota bacterium]
MSMDAERLLRRIHVGEDSLLELRRVVLAGDELSSPSRDELADELAALANAHGGLVVLGVDARTREIVGVPEQHADAVVRVATELSYDAIRPALLPRIQRVEVPGADASPRTLVCIHVDRSLFLHEGPSGYLYRSGERTRRMSSDFLARMLLQRSQARLLRFDETPIPATTMADLDPALVDRFRSPRSADARDVFARKMAIAAEDWDGSLRPTVAGLLLGCRSPEQWLRSACIQAVAYRGERSGSGGAGSLRGYQLDARDIGGPLDQQVVEACRFVHRNMRIEASKSLGRIEVPQYDLEAVFEALVNSVAHRDYSMHGSRIRLHMFSDRLELYSPGALASSMSIDSLELRQAARNETICSLLARCPVPRDASGVVTQRATFMDRRGEGVGMVLARTEVLARKRAVYSLPTEAELVLTIPAATALDYGGET